MNSRIKPILIIEGVLALLTVAIYFLTINADDFSGLIVVYPMIAMAVVAIIGVAVVLINGSSNQKNSVAVPKYDRGHIGALMALSIPILYIAYSFLGFGVGNFALLYMLGLILEQLFSKNGARSGIYLNYLLIALLVGLACYSYSLDDTNIFIWTSIISGILIVLHLKRLISKKG